MLSEIHRVLTPTGAYICVSHGVESVRKKYLKNVSKYNWIRTKTLIQKPQLGQNFKEIKKPKEDDKKNFHFIYVCKKQTKGVIDSSDEEAVAAEKMRDDMEKMEKKAEEEHKKAEADAEKEAA